MSRITLTKILNNSSFADTTIPYKTFADFEKKIIAIANSFFTQWSGRHVSMYSNSLLLYNLDTLQLVNFIDNLGYGVNDLTFHPRGKIIAIGAGSYDGGAYYEGELLLWNYGTNELNSIFSDNREVTKCEFNQEGTKIKFTVNPTDDLDCPDYTDKQYEIDLPVLTKLSLENLNPVSITDHIDNFNIEDYANRLLKSENELSNISKNVNQDYFNSHLIWDILFINHREIIVARNNSTVEIWNIETGKSKHVKLPENGDCVELHINSSTNSLLVNLWNRNFQFNNTNKQFSIDLSDLKISEIISCSHTISKSKNNYFLARQTDHSDKSKKDFILILL